MKYTSAEANKLLKKLNEEKVSLILHEDMSKEFLAAVGEDLESVRPKYNFTEMQNSLDEVERKIRLIKHALNKFNTTTVIPEFNITIDEMLILIPQLTAKKIRLEMMKNRVPKTREMTRANSNILDYRYINYDLDVVAKEYEKVVDTLAKAQNALDLVNMSKKIEIDL